MNNRQQLVILLCSALDGTATYSDCLSCRFDQSLDDTVSIIWFELDELFFDDIYPDAPIRLCDDDRIILQRTILFLKANRTYHWPKSQDNAHGVLSILIIAIFIVACFLAFYYTYSVGFVAFAIEIPLLINCILHYYRHRQSLEKWKELGDFHVWPFFNETDYESSKHELSLSK